MSEQTTTTEQTTAEYAVALSRSRSEYAYISIRATDADSAENAVNELLASDKLDSLVFHPGGDTEGPDVMGATPIEQEPEPIDCAIAEDGSLQFATSPQQQMTVRALAETISVMTLDGECPSCMLDAEIPNPECDDHHAFRMTAEDNEETLTALILRARSLIEEHPARPDEESNDTPDGVELSCADYEALKAKADGNVHPIFAGILKQHFPWLGTDENAGSGADVIRKVAELYVSAGGESPTYTPSIVWTKPLSPCGPEDNPEVKLLGQVSIDRVPFQAEAYEVREDENDGQVGIQEEHETWLPEVLNIVQGAAYTIDINGRSYVLAITPSQR